MRADTTGPPPYIEKRLSRFAVNHARHIPPKTENPKLFIGPAGWDYPDWQGVVYPPGLKGADRLTFLATWFGAVEINVTFYRPIPPDYARRWLAAVADSPDFRFTAKVWQVFTHERRLPEPELAQFREGLAPLLAGGKLGVLLAQFPYSFHNTEENRALSGEAEIRLTKISPGRGGAPPLLAAAGRAGVFGAGGPGFLQHRPAYGLLPHGRHPVGHRAAGGTCAATGGGKMPGLSSGRTGEPGMTTSTPPRNWRIWRPGPGS